jgi:hypothetical protein
MAMSKREADMRATSSHFPRGGEPPAAAQGLVEEALPAERGVVVDHGGVAAAARAVVVAHVATSNDGGQALPPVLLRLHYSVTVHSVFPLLSMATIERVALPPDVAAGTVTNT